MSLPRVPGPDEVCIFVNLASGREGPVTRRDLAGRVASGQIARSAHVWFEGMAEWETVGAVSELLADLGSAPAEPPDTQSTATTDDEKDAVFTALVKDSWDWLADHEFAGHVDEVFVGAVITSTLDAGFFLIDITSDGTHHYLRFEQPSDRSRIIVRLTHLTGTLTAARVLGQRARVTIGYGERVKNLSKIMGAVKAEMKSGYLSPEPGTITVDGDVGSGYVYVQVELFLNIDEYVARSYEVNYSKLTTHIDATVNALRKYLRGRFQG